MFAERTSKSRAIDLAKKSLVERLLVILPVRNEWGRSGERRIAVFHKWGEFSTDFREFSTKEQNR